jgi:hypothetical protein
VLTLICGASCSCARQGPAAGALQLFFIEPLRGSLVAARTGDQGGPADPDRVGLSFAIAPATGISAPKASSSWAAIFGSILPVVFYTWQLAAGAAADDDHGHARRRAVMPAIPACSRRIFNTNEILTSLMLVYIAQLFLDWLVRGPWRNPEGHEFPGNADLRRVGHPAGYEESGRAHWGFGFAIIAAVLSVVHDALHAQGLRDQGAGPVRRAGRFAGFSSRMVWFSMLLSGALAGLAGISEVSGDPLASCSRSFRPATASPRSSSPSSDASIRSASSFRAGAGADLSRRRGGAGFAGVSDKVTRVFQGLLLFFVLSCDTLIHYKIRIVWSRVTGAERQGEG